MQFNAVVDVVIGLVTLFWIVATAASFVVEAISSFMNVRGKALEMFVREMLVGTNAAQTMRRVLNWFPRASQPERMTAILPPGPIGLAEIDITDHPLVCRLGKPAASIRGNDTPPSYIPADLFAKALLDRLRQMFGVLLAASDAVRSLHTVLPEPIRQQASVELHSALSTLEAATAWGDLLAKIAADPNPQSLLDNALQALDGPAKIALSVVAASLPTPQSWVDLASDPQRFVTSVWPQLEAALGSRSLSVADVQAIVSSGRLPPPLAVALRPLLDAANHDMEAFRKALEGWYDSVMDRASGWFRRYAQWWLGGIALIIAVAFNLDTVYIGQRLLADREAREASVRVGEVVVQQGERASSLVQTYAFNTTFGDGKWAAPLNLTDAADPTGDKRLQAANALAMRVQPMLLNSGVTVGPMLALQAVALQGEARCIGKSDGDCMPTAAAQRWANQSESQNALKAAVCRAAMKRPEDIAWAADLSDAQLIEQISANNAKPSSRCRTEIPIRQNGEGAFDTLGRLWSSSQVVWNPALGAAAFEVRKLATPGAVVSASEKIAAARGLGVAMGNAVADARTKVQGADDVLSRLPHVGLGKAWAIWREIWETKTEKEPVLPVVLAVVLAVLWSIVGWAITAFMASLGAPMWFDLLNKLVNRRITGPKPEASAGSVT